MADIEPRDPKVSGEPDKTTTPGTSGKPGVIDAETGAAATGTVRTEGGAPVQESAVGPLGMSARGWLGTALAGLIGLLLGTLIGGLGDDEEERLLALQEQSAIIDEQRAGLVALDARIGGLGNELAARVADVGTRLDRTNDLIDAITAVLSQQVDDTNRGTRAVLSAIEAGAGSGEVETAVAELGATVEERLASVSDAVAAQGGSVEDVSARLDALASDVSEATSSVGTATGELEQATDRLAIADDRFDLLADRVAVLGDRIDALASTRAPRVGTVEPGGLRTADEADARDVLGVTGTGGETGAASASAVPTGDDTATGAGIGDGLPTALPDGSTTGTDATGAGIGEGLGEALPDGDTTEAATGAGIGEGLATALPDGAATDAASPLTNEAEPAEPSPAQGAATREATGTVTMVPIGQRVALGTRSLAVAAAPGGEALLTPEGYAPQTVPRGSALDFGDGCTIRVSAVSDNSITLVSRGCDG